MATTATATLALLAACSNPESERRHEPAPRGQLIGTQTAACDGRLARSDLQALLGDPSSLIDTGFFDPEQVGDCRLFDAAQERWVLRVDIAAGSSSGYDMQATEGRTHSHAVVQAHGDAFPDLDGITARAIVRTPLRYIVIVLRQKPITPEKVRLILAMANRIATTRSGTGPAKTPDIPGRGQPLTHASANRPDQSPRLRPTRESPRLGSRQTCQFNPTDGPDRPGLAL
jgi:hypothetical protein